LVSLNGGQSPLYRIALTDASSGMPQKFPRIDERRFGQRYRYAHTVSVLHDGDLQLIGAIELYKHDLENGSRRVHEFGDGYLPGEFVFVPARHDAGEDEGWLIGFVIDSVGATTDLTILDAHSFKSAPVATVWLPHRIPPGFHGNWFTAVQLLEQRGGINAERWAS
jgi:carotenoid cleavage dioxygenase-like enzyme